MGNKHKIKKVLLLGSGGLKIGQGGEFDYSGSQAIKALKEEGVRVVLINPNIATVQTDPGLADMVYFLPLTLPFAKKVIEKERPDAILLSFGGQSALNLGLELDKGGVLKKYHMRVLGTPVSAIQDTEDRELFIKRLKEIGVKTAKSFAARNVRAALRAAEKIGYPVMMRSGFALGGEGSGVLKNSKELTQRAMEAFRTTTQVLIEEYLLGWKEVEYEVVRDSADNCVVVCNMENLDPMGIHTGESMVVAPSQTLTNEEYHRLREIAIQTVRHLGIVGECNIQYALHPKTGDYRVIEVNARLSRSSALASKATGYPLAFVAAKIALGSTLPNLTNAVTKTTSACFEPALDYLVLKLPRWDLGKFENASARIGTEMKSVGEVMAIGRSFEEVLQKGLRMLCVGADGLTANRNAKFVIRDFAAEIKNPTPRRVFAIAEALRAGWSVKKIHKLSWIDPWFLEKMKNIIKIEQSLRNCPESLFSRTRVASPRERGALFSSSLSASGGTMPARTAKVPLKQLSSQFLQLLLDAKKHGFADVQIAEATGSTEEEIRALRIRKKILPAVKQIDTLAGEFPAQTNYLYLTYHGSENDVAPTESNRAKNIIVLGSGPYSIGSSVEFDWSSVQALKTLKAEGHITIMINYNPETVSTDYDESSRLYFEELSLERVLDIVEFEKPKGVVISMGGQIPNNLAMPLSKNKSLGSTRILGTDPKNIDRAEDRKTFSDLLDRIGVDQPLWAKLSTEEKALQTAEEFGYPLLVRPSYVLSGAAMSVAFDRDSLLKCLRRATDVSAEHPVVISKFIENAREIEIDGVATKGELTIYAITEHVENAGTHSGDATVVMPPQHTYLETIRRAKHITREVVKELSVTGPFNIQFLAKENRLQVIECNVRASRSFPFISKASGYNFAELATRALLGKDISGEYRTVDLDYCAVKSPQFSYRRIKGADPLAYVEMASTGEVACFSESYSEALLQSMQAAGFRLPKKNILISLGKEENKVKLLPALEKFVRFGLNIFATEHTADFLQSHNIACTKVYKIHTKKEPNVSGLFENDNTKGGRSSKKGKLDLIINIPASALARDSKDGFIIRRKAVDLNIPLITNRQLAEAFILAFSEMKERGRNGDFEVKPRGEYR